MSSSPRQPRKKRRIDSQEREVGVPPEVLPLVSPIEVLKSSKDPNRGMYPRRTTRSKTKQKQSYPSFCNASQMMQEASTSKDTEDSSMATDTFPDLNSIDVAGPSQQVVKMVPRCLSSVKAKTKKPISKSKFPFGNLSYPSFCNASQMMQEASTSKDTEDSSMATDNFPDLNSIDEAGPSQQVVNMVPRCLSSVKAKTKKPISKSKFPVVNFANNILKYFKSVSWKGKDKGESSSSSDDFQRPSTSKAPDPPVKLEASNKTEIPEAGTSKISVEERNATFFNGAGYCYGLLGAANELEENRPNYFERLPGHVLEIVLCQVPFLDLMNCKLVCSTWNEIIRDEAFICFKKIYYSVKFNREKGIIYIEDICNTYKLSKVEDCFSVLIKYMAEDFSIKPACDMYKVLSENIKAAEAELVLAERFPEVLLNESKAWSIFATAILISETVEDVYRLYKSVYTLKSETTLHDITNAMYCIASFLLYFRDTYKINNGLHYRVYNAIYWIENSLPAAGSSQRVQVAKGLPGQQSIHSYCDSMKSNLTYEQIRILNHRFQPKQRIKIVAMAGTGKTTTLIHLAQLYPQVQFLTIMFNKSVCDDAKKRFPSNVTCRTAHSLAFEKYGKELRHKLSSKIRPHDIVQHLQHNTGSNLHIHTYAKQVLSSIENFVASDSSCLERDHVSSYLSDTMTHLETEDVDKLFKDVKQIWQKMINPDNKQVRITHDTYLKVYQLSNPRFHDTYQCIMVDEAQDCNPAILKIVMSQNLPVIMVGDPNQQIYGFRGARNALQNLKVTHTYHLTKSFRFGPEIAYVASCCLEELKRTTKQTIVGSNKPSTVNGVLEGQYAIIARSNVQLFNEAIRLCCLRRFRGNEPTSIQGAFAGGLQGYGFDQMLDIHKLASRKGGQVSDKFISKFKTYKELVSYAKSVDDNELCSKIDIVDLHRSDLPEYVKTIKEKCSHPMELANVIFTTAHKSKGLEFDTVSLTDDYILPQRQRIVPRYPFPRAPITDFEENNVIYVALTRAKRSLVMPDKLLRVLLLAQEKFEHPKLRTKVLGDHTEVECVNCMENFSPHTVMVLVRRRIVVASGRTIPGGPLCVRCATEPMVRPRLTVEPVIMYLDPTADYAHRSMAALVGPLPSDPPIVRESLALNDMDVVYVINLHM